MLQVSLELGGKSPHLIFESADLEQGEKSIHLSINNGLLFSRYHFSEIPLNRGYVALPRAGDILRVPGTYPVTDMSSASFV